MTESSNGSRPFADSQGETFLFGAVKPGCADLDTTSFSFESFQGKPGAENVNEMVGVKCGDVIENPFKVCAPVCLLGVNSDLRLFGCSSSTPSPKTSRSDDRNGDVDWARIF